MTGRSTVLLERPRRLLLIAQFATIAVAIVFPFLVDAGYRIADLELLVLSAGGGFIGLLLAFLSRYSALVRRLSFAVLVYWLLDLYFIASDAVAWLALSVVIGVALTHFEEGFRNVSAFFALFFVFIGAISPPVPLINPPISHGAEVSARRSAPDLPLVVHFILDEQGSPLTFSSGLDASGDVSRLFSAYTERGFAAYTWVRATTGATQRSLGRVFGPEHSVSGEPNWIKVDGDFTYRLKRNHHLETLLDQGFDVTVVQNSFIQLCVDLRAKCHTYPRSTYGHSMTKFPGAWKDRLRLTMLMMHAEQYAPEGIRRVALYQLIGDWFVGMGHLTTTKRQFWTRPATVLDVLDELEYRAAFMRPGEAYLVHLLAPHFPYVLDANCGLRPMSDWELPAWTSEIIRSPGKVQAAYWYQMECLHKRLLRIIEVIDRNVEREKSLIIMHGDHGPRLEHKGARPTAARLVSELPDGSLDTILLARSSGVEPGVDSDRFFLDQLFWQIIYNNLSPKSTVFR